MKTAFYALLFIVSITLHAFCQSPKMDSLKLAFRKAKHDTTRCHILAIMVESDYDEKVWPVYNEQLKTLCELRLKDLSSKGSLHVFYSKYLASTLNNVGFIYDNEGDMTKALDYYNQSLRIRLAINDKTGLSRSYINIGTVYQFKGDIPKALEYLQKALKIQAEVKDKHGMAYSLINIGLITSDQGNVPLALEYYHRSLKIREEIQDKEGMAVSLNNIAYVYNRQGDMQKALEYYQRSRKILESINDQRGIARALNNIGSIYRNQNDIPKAFDYFSRALKINEALKDKRGIASSLSNLAFIYKNHGDPSCDLPHEVCLKDGLAIALDYHQRSLKMYEETKDKKTIVNSLVNIALIYNIQSRPVDALAYANRSMSIAKELGYPESIKNAASVLKEIYQKQNNYKKALEMHELFIQMKDSIDNETTRKASVRKQFQIEYEKQATKDSLANEVKIKGEQFKHEQAISQQRIYTYGGLIGFLLMLIVAGVSFRAFKNKQKANIIITEQKHIADAQKHIIEEKQKEILDSITYAKRLQDAILPPANLIETYFPECFILYKPKDIVAGDFYWFEHNADLLFIAAADSTGHGVPGAMVSVVCSNALNRAVNEFKITDTGKILDKTRDLVLDTFAKSESDVKDGMDISLMSLKKERMTSDIIIKWSGANNALWYIRNDELIEIKAHKQPIGKTENPTPFPENSISLNKGDVVYLITDGYPDQFGGPKGKKFKYKQLELLLLSIHTLPMKEQKQILDKTFCDWKGDLEQVDDVTIIGVKLT
ncbi:MAG: tetratricopeptide repeat protein [Bacteroidota bacterium]